ncbi:hypothetical protein [Aerolutibacter daejeonensis]|uniref:hypothetical protein n=1 Tax=Aerolutibacter daejeonensis TaxID=346181 RepID=UPI000ACFF3E6|nr:hypothetical protein [Lysobacter daejeonensis]
MRPLARLLGLWDRLWCCFGRHAYGYHPGHDAVFCFACGATAPLRVWADLYPLRHREGRA